MAIQVSLPTADAGTGVHHITGCAANKAEVKS